MEYYHAAITNYASEKFLITWEMPHNINHVAQRKEWKKLHQDANRGK